MKFLAVLAMVLALGIVSSVHGSSHSEAPGTSATPAADNTDFYFFRSYETGRENFVTIMSNFYGIQNPYGGPNYFSLSSDHYYEIYFDFNGDVVEDLTFQFQFSARMGGTQGNYSVPESAFDCPSTGPTTAIIFGGQELNIGGQSIAIPLKFFDPVTSSSNANLNWFETYTINVISGLRNGTGSLATHGGSTEFIKPFDYAGEKSFPDYPDYAEQYIYDLTWPGCSTSGSKVFAGQRKEPFSVNLGPVFDLINFVPIPGFPGVIPDLKSNNILEDRNVVAIELELPIACLSSANGVIGAWSAVRKLLHVNGSHVPGSQTSRLGHPLVNEIVIGLRDKFKFNAGEPKDDVANQFGPYVFYPTFPEVINREFKDTVNQVLNADFTTIAPTNFPRNDLVAVFLTGIETINKPAGGAIGEVLRLNVTVPPTPAASQNNLGVIGGDLAGFPNGRRPGDDVVDIALDVVMGALCWIDGLGFCNSSQAVVGFVRFTDGAPQSVDDFDSGFPYFKTPVAGSRTGQGNASSSASTLLSPLAAMYYLFQ